MYFKYRNNHFLIIILATILVASLLVNFGYNYVDAQKEPTTRDTDSDGILNNKDNCPTVLNRDQRDSDGDRIGDVCDDSDNDGIVDANDNCPNTPNRDQKDSDGDGTGDVCDSTPILLEVCGDGVDNDHDGQVDENCPTELCGDGVDNDRDGQVDENCPEWCGDGKDNNGNGLVDEICPEICGDGKDNNYDGVVDENCPTEAYTATLIVTTNVVGGSNSANEFMIYVWTIDSDIYTAAIPLSAPGSTSGYPYKVKPGNIYIDDGSIYPIPGGYALTYICDDNRPFINDGETIRCTVTIQ